jgi:hypothetical protein
MSPSARPPGATKGHCVALAGLIPSGDWLSYPAAEGLS